MVSVLILLAQGKKGGGDLTIYLLGIMVLFFVFFIILPKRRQEKEKASLLSQLEKNDKIQTIGGIMGTIVSNNDQEDYVTIKIDDNCKMKILRGAVHRNITKEEALAAQKAGGEAKTA